MRRLLRRRELLGLTGASITGLAGCNNTDETAITRTGTDEPTSTVTASQTESTSSSETPTPEPIDTIEHDRLIGAQYYAWYWGKNGFGGHYLGSDSSEGWLSTTPGSPILGAYNSRNEEIINQHMRWSLEHGINWWIITGGAPDGPIDRTIRNVVFEADYADQMKFTWLIGFPRKIKNKKGFFDFNDPRAKELLIDRFRHWEEEYVPNSNYLRIDGKPVLYFWSTNRTTGGMAQAIQTARDAIDIDAYLIGGPQYYFEPHQIRKNAAAFDCILDYSAYFPNKEYLENIVQRTVEDHRDWRVAAHEHGVDFIPTILPGWDKSEAPAKAGGGRSLPPLDRDVNRFRTLCRRLRGMGDHDAIIITSFNEWPEYTAIEPGESYGTQYLEIVADELARAEWNTPPEPEFTSLTFDFNRTMKPSSINSDSSDDRDLAFMAAELKLSTPQGSFVVDVGGDEGRTFYTGGAYRKKSNDKRSWRWFGGDWWPSTDSGRTQIYVPTGDISGLTLTGRAIVDDISAVVQVGEDTLGTIAFDGTWGQYSLD